MSLRRRTSLRSVVALVAAVSVLAIAWGGASALASGTGRPNGADAASTASTTTGIALPPREVPTDDALPIAWCCPNGGLTGLTVTGQASVHGQGTSARDTAIAQAVADATDQAKAAAGAAGVSLGRILDLQVSAPPYAYPLGMEASGSAVSPPAEGSSGGSGVGCPESSCPPIAMPVRVESFASVTITWSIG
jgi:Protein of unknown function (DUF541)